MNKTKQIPSGTINDRIHVLRCENRMLKHELRKRVCLSMKRRTINSPEEQTKQKYLGREIIDNEKRINELKRLLKCFK